MLSGYSEAGRVDQQCADIGVSGYLKLEVPQQLLCRGFVTSALEGAACVSAIIVRRHLG